MAITLKRLTEKADLQTLEMLEGAVWSEDSVIPLHMTLTLAKFGGLFLGAFDGDEMIGFLYSFPGFTDGEPHLCSHMLGFLPAYRKRGLGVRMKWRQREEALKLGHTKITWTYDPLEAVNAYLNLAKLGGVVRRYLPNCYGELNDEMNRGLPTDRFLVEWFIASERVSRYHAGQPKRIVLDAAVPQVLSWNLSPAGVPVPGQSETSVGEPVIAVPIPSDFQQVKRTDMGIATEWRTVTREVFQRYLNAGYAAVDVVRSQSQPVVTYVLQKGVELT